MNLNKIKPSYSPFMANPDRHTLLQSIAIKAVKLQTKKEQIYQTLLSLRRNIRHFDMDIIKLPGTNKKLYELVCPLVMNPAVLRQNNNYPFKTSVEYVWYVATEKEETIGFMPVKTTEANNYLIDNYYVKGDNLSLLKSLLEEVIKNHTDETELWATVHKRHVELFAQNGFHVHVEWKNYDKMKYCPMNREICTD